MNDYRSVDKLIAEKVFRKITYWGKNDLAFFLNERGLKQLIPEYSNDMSCAGLVVEEMRKKGFVFTLTVDLEISKAMFIPVDGNFKQCWSVERDYTAEAITIAALKALGVDINDNKKG